MNGPNKGVDIPWILTKGGMIGMACLPLYYMRELGLHKVCVFVAVSWWMIFGFYHTVFDRFVWEACFVALGSALFGILIIVFAPFGCPPWENEE